MTIQNEFDRALDELGRQLDEGLMSQAEYNRELRALDQDYRGAAEEAAHAAYRDELNRW